MEFERILIEIGGTPVILLDVLTALAIFALLLLVAAVVLSWRAQANRTAGLRRTAELEYRIAELSGTLKSLIEQSHGSQMQLVSTLDERLGQASERTGQSLKQLSERLAIIDAAQKNIEALSSEMLGLKDILSNKQARGAYGQARMEAIIRDGLHAGAYAFQGTLSNGTRPDCLVTLPDSSIRLVIDAKFPLEAFNALKVARGEGEIRNAEARLRGDVLKHVRDIAEKYLISGETHETAIMFVPSESIYAELYERFEDVLQKANRARVIIASPNVLMLLVQTLQAIFKDARMREQAGLIKVEVTRLLEDVERLKERVGDLQKHFGAAAGDLEKLAVSAGKITTRAGRIESLDLQEDSAAPRPKLVERSS
jgi:DNA recombination protein RmuC